MLLPELLQERQRYADDSETARLVLRTAKSFFTELMKSNGRRSDIQRNAFVAGLVALLPRVSHRPHTTRAPFRADRTTRNVLTAPPHRADHDVLTACADRAVLTASSVLRDPCISQLAFEQPQCGALLPVGRTSLRIGRVALPCACSVFRTGRQSWGRVSVL